MAIHVASLLVLCLPLTLAACGRGDVPGAPDPGNQATQVMATSVAPRPESPALLAAQTRAAIRGHVAIDYAPHCQLIELPDEAFIPIPLNPNGLPAYAVAFGRAGCAEMGATGFSSTGGSLVQFWTAAADGSTRMVAGAHMLGFSAARQELRTLQHGATCGLPGAAGCIVTYRFDGSGDVGVTRRPGNGVREKDFQHRGFEGRPRSEPGARDRKEQLALMKAVIRQDAILSYAQRCGAISMPDNAFHEVEISGDDFPELAVSLGRSDCPAGGANSFDGTGGPLVQFWYMARDYTGGDGPVRLLLETAMHGFSPIPGGLRTIQHGGRCPGGAGPEVCRVVYRWEAKERRLDAVEQVFQPPEGLEGMRYGRAQLSWVGPS